MSLKDKKALLITNGCPENRIDLARMQELLKENNWLITKKIKEADLILFNTCGLTKQIEETTIKMIKQLKRKKKSTADLIVFGCLSKINLNRLRENYDGYTFGSDDIDEFIEILDLKTDTKKVCANYLLPYCNNLRKFNIPKLKDIESLMYIDTFLRDKFNERLYEAINIYRPDSFIIKVSTGCVYTCAYCAVRISRGRVRSKSIAQIQREFEKGLAEGFKEFSIIGTDLGSYGKDIGTDLVALLQKLITLSGDYQIRLRNLHPKFLINRMDELKSIFQTGKISYLESAVQSGNNRILKLMNRPYTIENYKKAISILNKQFPDIKIRTQFIVGFPGETDAEFRDTLNLIDDICFDLVEVYRFEPRPGTKADAMNDIIPEKVARKRYYQLLRKSILNQKVRKKKAMKEYIEKYQQVNS